MIDLRCDVCGHEMRQLPSPDPDQEWACTWCYARSTVWARSGDVTRPQYEPATTRWEEAEGDDLPPDESHAAGYFGATLCGRYSDAITASEYPWIPTRQNTCPDCRKAAEIIDDRWPAEKRNGNRERIPLTPGSDAPPF
ncbi:hypothetical protein [Paractinoplanes atraurantiacus]|uniref:Uncharacterized protein n=1 Tax=Paractinoplanes atraurantiacus TaxID=1036182 RepID=A0A285KBI0_9ACTN|nr:hypothetical protein [Actinoplanes atraurantiacus]SNY69613.1 hypothetical protein SAMN05421748_13587 [Actinoplanes atraurantiacus]